jgi:hypothetical protein
MTAPRRRKLTAERVRELLDCDPSTGTLRCKERPVIRASTLDGPGASQGPSIAPEGIAG